MDTPLLQGFVALKVLNKKTFTGIFPPIADVKQARWLIEVCVIHPCGYHRLKSNQLEQPMPSVDTGLKSLPLGSLLGATLEALFWTEHVLSYFRSAYRPNNSSLHQTLTRVVSAHPATLAKTWKLFLWPSNDILLICTQMSNLIIEGTGEVVRCRLYRGEEFNFSLWHR